MDRNTLIALALTGLLWFGWQYSLDRRYPHRNDRPVATAQAPREPTAAPGPSAPNPAPLSGGGPLDAPAAPPAVEQQIVVERELYTATFTTRGGSLREWVLHRYDDASLPGRPPVSITTTSSALSLATPALELGLGDLSDLAYAVQRPSDDVIEFSAELGAIQIRKTYRLEPEGYGARLSIEIENRSAAPIGPAFGVQWPATRGTGAEFSDYALATYSTGKVTRFAISPLPSMLGIGGGPADDPVTVAPKEGEAFELDWAGAETRYFIAAILPDNPRDARAAMTPIVPGSEAQLTVSFAPVSLPPGEKLARDYRLYLGPKEPARLDAFGAHLDEAIQKGWVPWLARFFTSMLTSVHRFVPNYGLAILLLTLVMRVAMAPLMVGQMRSMKKMSELMPKVKAAQDAAKARYPDDPAKQQEAAMAVYQQAGVNPLATFGGCLPMLAQMPVFVGFYSALQGSIHLRQQPFFGWITDLSQPESLFVIPGLGLHVRALPLLLGGAMVLQQRLTPTPNADPAQARMMQIVMPVMMTLMFYQFASGLGLYWLMSTLLGIGQQLLMNRSKTPAAA